MHWSYCSLAQHHHIMAKYSFLNYSSNHQKDIHSSASYVWENTLRTWIINHILLVSSQSNYSSMSWNKSLTCSLQFKHIPLLTDIFSTNPQALNRQVFILTVLSPKDILRAARLTAFNVFTATRAPFTDMYLTHWGRATHICVSKLTNIGSDNGLSPGRRQAIIWTNAEIFLIRTLGTNFSEILSEIHEFSFKTMHLKMSSGKWRPSCLGLNVLRHG